MNIITTTTLNGFSSSFLTLEGEVNTTIRNLIKHHKNAGVASIDCPNDNFIFTLEDGTIETVSSAIVYLRLTSASKTALDDLSSWKYGRIVKGVMIAEYATTVYSATVKTVKTVKTVLSASSQLKADILAAFGAKIDDLKLTLASATTSPMIDDYLEVVKGTGTLYIDGIGINTDATTSLLNLEQLQETIEQIESCFSGTRTEYETNVIDSSTLEVQLSNYDNLNNSAIIERLSKFNFNGTFDPDKSKVLAKLQVQVLTIKL